MKDIQYLLLVYKYLGIANNNNTGRITVLHTEYTHSPRLKIHSLEGPIIWGGCKSHIDKYN